MFRKLLTQNSLAEKLSSLHLQYPAHKAIAAETPQIKEATATAAASHEPPRPMGKWWGNRIAAHIKYHAKREAQELAAKQVRERSVVYMDLTSKKSSLGDGRLNKLNFWLNNLGVQRSPDQTLFHKHFTNACLPKIYGAAEWNDASVRVMRMRGISRLRYEVTAITPRRWGKTWSVAMFVLALMLSCPGIRICVFSTGKRASSSLMEIICQVRQQRTHQCRGESIHRKISHISLLLFVLSVHGKRSRPQRAQSQGESRRALHRRRSARERHELEQLRRETRKTIEPHVRGH